MIRNFSEITSLRKKQKSNAVVAMVNAVDEHSIQTAIIAKEEHDVNSILIGDQEKIKALLKNYNKANISFRIVHASSPVEAGQEAVKLIHSGDAHILMKGHLQTGDLIRPVLNRETGLRISDTLSNIALLDIPKYHKILGVTDAGLVLNPDFEQKRKIIENALTIFHALKYDRPKVGIIEANEEVNSKVPSSLEAEQLMILQQKNVIQDCIIDGPISVDVALDAESAKYKNYESEVAGDADIIVGPIITVASAIIKALITFGDAKVAAFIVGAKCPIISNSRSTSIEEKVDSILIALAIHEGGQL